MPTRPFVLRPITAILGLVVALALAGVVAAAETTLTGSLSGDAETDEDGTGTASVVLDPEAGTACWELTVENIDPVAASHIHVGATGESGDVVVPLDVDGFEGSSEGCTDGVDAEVLQAVIDDPAGHYVNVHTEPFPGGAIRGQLTAGSQPDTALAQRDGTLPTLGLLLLVVAAAVIGLRTRRPGAVRR